MEDNSHGTQEWSVSFAVPGSRALQVSGVCHSEAGNPKARIGSYDTLSRAQLLEGSWPRGLQVDCAVPSVITKCGHLGWKALLFAF